MEKCIACGKIAIVPDRIGKVILCKMCSIKIKTPFWKNKLFINADKLKQQKEKVVNAALSKGFSREAIDGLNEYFYTEEIAGFMGAIDGGCGQTIKVYRDFCVINTDKEKFDINNISKKYAKIKQSTQTQMGFFDNPSRQEAVIKGVLSGKLAKTGIGLAKSAVVDAARKEIFSRKEQIQVNFDDRVIRYGDYDDIEFMNIDDSDIGYMRFFNQFTEVQFFFAGKSSYDNSKLKKKMLSIYNMINECLHNAINQKQATQRIVSSDNSFFCLNNKDNFEEIRKYKVPLDEGIISQTEFDQKKKEFLGL